MAELENKKAYISMMNESLKKKIEVLEEIYAATLEQEKQLQLEKPDMEIFDKAVDDKDKLLELMNKLDVGFDDLYAKVQVELNINKTLYRAEIEKLQQMIATITEFGVKIKTLEERNRVMLERYLTEERKGIKSFKVNRKTAAAYYKNMSGTSGQPSFMDKRK